jgi:hypothetical protein
MTPPARSLTQRVQDALHRLEHDVDAWVATADPSNGRPYLVPLSFDWDGTPCCWPHRHPAGPAATSRPPAGSGSASAPPGTSCWSRGLHAPWRPAS